MTETFDCSHHAELRMCQRNLSLADVRVVLQYGRKEQRAGVIAYFLGHRQLEQLVDARPYERLEGTVVLWCPRRAKVVTVYRNRGRGLKDHRRKSKYDCKARFA